jgi:hypothetical protein
MINILLFILFLHGISAANYLFLVSGGAEVYI